jgi:hypothetical protein
MKKKFLLVLVLVFSGFMLHGQSGTVTNNNTITINGDVYYFKPSTSPSSPLPKVSNSSNWIGDGEWWGADAAKAWASIVNWTVLHCTRKGAAPSSHIVDSYNNYVVPIVYINRLSAKKYTDKNGKITIYYWLVSKNDKMEQGRPELQQWWVEF